MLNNYIKKELKKLGNKMYDLNYIYYTSTGTFYGVVMNYFEGSLKDKVSEIILEELKEIEKEEILEIIQKEVDIDLFKLAVLENMEIDELVRVENGLYGDIMKEHLKHQIVDDLSINFDYKDYITDNVEANNAINRFLFLEKRGQLGRYNRF